jgi:hypothetical protein
MLAMVVNDNALNQMPRGALGFFASMLAPTGMIVPAQSVGTIRTRFCWVKKSPIAMR